MNEKFANDCMLYGTINSISHNRAALLQLTDSEDSVGVIQPLRCKTGGEVKWPWLSGRGSANWAKASMKVLSSCCAEGSERLCLLHSIKCRRRH